MAPSDIGYVALVSPLSRHTARRHRPARVRDSGDGNAGVRAQYDRMASDYDRRWARYLTLSVEATLRRLALAPDERLLDVGCGTGVLLAAIPPATQGLHAGVDLVPAMLARAAAKLGSRSALAAADAMRLPFRDQTFDVVVSTSSLHYWQDPDAALAEIYRVLRPGGRLLLTDWCDDYLLCKLVDLASRLLDPAYRRSYGVTACRVLLRRAGFGDLSVERYKITWLWGLMTARGERAGREPDGERR